MNLKLIAGLVLLASILGGLFGLYRYGRHVEAVKQEAARVAAISEQQAKNDALKTELEIKHGNDQKQIDALAADLRRLRVRLPAGCSNPNPTSGSANTVAGNQSFPVAPQDAFNRFNEGLGELAKEADDVVARCRVVTDWAKEQGK